jgi:hypothetical protein
LSEVPGINPLEPVVGQPPIVAVDTSLAFLGESDIGIVAA